MDRRAPRGSVSRSGVVVLGLILAVAGLGLAVGSGWLVALAAIGTLDLAAVVAGRDSRAPGDWRSAGMS